MCYHNALTKVAVNLEQRYHAEMAAGDEFEPMFHANGYNYPLWPVITADNPSQIQLFNWGLIPHWCKSWEEALKMRANTLNAKSETVFDKPSFRFSINQKRCLVPSSGFFEWQDYKGKKYPYFIHLKDIDTFSMAGIYSHWTDRDTGELFDTFSILTTIANPLMEKIHNVKLRMPVIIDPEKEGEWINPDLDRPEIERFFLPYDENKMTAHTISKLITSRSENSNTPEVMAPYNYPELNPAQLL